MISDSRRATNGKLPIHKWPLWKALGASFLLFLPFSSFLLIIPPYFSTSAWLVSGSIVALGMVAANIGRFGPARLSEIAASFIFTVQLLAIAVRSFAAVMPLKLIWLGPLLLAYVLIWILPFVWPKLSETIFHEQMAPTTRIGRHVFVLALGIAPAAGVLGASFGMYSARFGDTFFVWVVVGLLASFVTLSWGQSIAHQLFHQQQGSDS